MTKKSPRKYRDVFEFLEKIGTHFTGEEKIFIKAMAQIGGQLLAYRKEHGLTQAELAKKLGISQAMVSKIEGGKNISIKVLAKVVAKLGGNINISLGILPNERDGEVEYRIKKSEEIPRGPSRWGVQLRDKRD